MKDSKFTNSEITLTFSTQDGRDGKPFYMCIPDASFALDAALDEYHFMFFPPQNNKPAVMKITRLKEDG